MKCMNIIFEKFRKILAIQNIICFFIFVCFLASDGLLVYAKSDGEKKMGEDSKFDDFEIRVIRPRYFNKKNRFEFGFQLLAITNQTSTYTYLISGIFGYHLTESFSLRLSTSTGVSVDKEDRTFLKNQFDIKTQVLMTDQLHLAEVVWAPIYGKYQLQSGRLIYFDTFLSAGAGLTNIAYSFDYCVLPRDEFGNVNGDRRKSFSTAYPSFSVGVGQRFFLDTDSGLNWDIKSQFFNADSADSSCNPEAKSETAMNQNVTIQFGYSLFL